VSVATTRIPIAVREARTEDAAALAEVYGESAEHHVRLDPSLYAPPNPAMMAERYRKRMPSGADSEIFVAEVAGEVVGMVEIQLKQPDGEPRMVRDMLTAEVDIAVLNDYRSQGIGTRLMEAAEKWAGEKGAALMTLSAHVANVDAIRFHQERHGWRTTGIVMMKRPKPQDAS
jgi:ribosomal protein S18 acetylase RimI-like enzyme